MKNIVGVRFKKLGKIYFFNPRGLRIRKGDFVVVETVQGQEYGEVLIANRHVEDEQILKPLKTVVRIATEKDKKHYEECRAKEKEAFNVCLEKIKKHNLDMTLTDVEYKFDNSKILFYFTADGRIDFRELVKDLASVYKTRIELRQIGVRDEVKRIGGNGVCGRELCCCSFLRNFETVSIKMAKEQNLSLNPAKVSGSCGRLMCCLKYEEEAYKDKLKDLPNVGAIVKTTDGVGEVEGLETLKQQIKVKIKDGDGWLHKKFSVADISIIKDSTKETVDSEELEHKKELEELEELEKTDTQNNSEI